MPTSTLHFRVLLHAENLRHGTHGFTSLPKEGVLNIFPPLKIRRLRPDLNSRTWVPEASTLTPRPSKPLPTVLKKSFQYLWLLYYRLGLTLVIAHSSHRVHSYVCYGSDNKYLFLYIALTNWFYNIDGVFTARYELSL
jgi:hypothetical protein